jgi:hypothetical protein
MVVTWAKVAQNPRKSASQTMYLDIPPNVWATFRKAASPGSWLGNGKPGSIPRTLDGYAFINGDFGV